MAVVAVVVVNYLTRLFLVLSRFLVYVSSRESQSES